MRSFQQHGPQHGLGQARPESFERYYLRQVAMGEGCNCAEQVLSQRDQQPLTSSGIVEALRALFPEARPMSVAVTRLDNGLTVASDTMKEVASVSLGVFVDVGTRHEMPQANGVAHLLEHMAFKGTRRRSARAIAEEIEAVGGHLNAYTGREGTAYYAKLLADDAGLALDILADILQDSVYDPEELARERQVVLQEIELAEDTPDDIVFDLYQETAFPDQALGRPVLGRAEIVSRLGREALVDYQDTNYGADRMVLAAAGRIEHDWLVERAEALFSGLSARGEAAPQPARYAGGELIEPRQLEQAHIVLGFPGLAARDPRIYAAAILSTLLGGGMSSRLFQEVREKRGLVYSIYTFVSHFKDGGLFSLYAGTGESEATELMPVVAEELAKVMQRIEPVEVERAAAQVRATLLMARESTGARAEALAGQISTFGRPLSTEELLAEIAAVDTAAVEALAREFFSGTPTLVAIGPTSEVEPLERFARRLA